MGGKKAEIVEELHRPARKNFPRRNTVLKGINDLYQADLVEMIPYSKVNRGFKYILTIINCFTKVADAFPLQNKTAKSIVEAMEQFLEKTGKQIKHLQTDHGKEFYNSSFRKLMMEYNINHYSTNSEMKAAIVERFNRTIKGDMYKRFSLRGTYVWYDILPDLIRSYNNRYHRAIGMKPRAVTKKNEDIVRDNIKKSTRIKDELRPPKVFHIGDQVRISKEKSIFSKKYLPNWTNEVFTVFRVQPTMPETYILKDKSGELLQGGFYGHELMKSTIGDVYLIEKILKRKKDRYFIRWLGFNSSHDSWVNKKDIV